MAMKDEGRRSEECKKGGRECEVLGMSFILIVFKNINKIKHNNIFYM